MKYLEGLIEWESDGLKSIPTHILQQYIVDINAELHNRKNNFVCVLGSTLCKCKSRECINFLKDGCEHYR
jgi:hypothetical protein